MFLLGGGVLLARLGQMQIAWHEEFSPEQQLPSTQGRPLPTVRGTIYSADGVELAYDRPCFDLSIHYSELEKEEWIDTVVGLMEVNRGNLRKRAQSIIKRVERIWRGVKEHTGLENLRIVEQEQYHPVVKDIPADVAAAVKAFPERFPKLSVICRAKRVYSEKSLAPQVVGRCAPISAEKWRELKAGGNIWTTEMPIAKIGKRYRQDDRIGVSGLEKFYESVLRGRRGYVEEEIYFRPLTVERRENEISPEPGYNIYLTLRADFQQIVNDSLRWASEQPQLAFKSGALVIVGVKTGALLAAGTYPSCDREQYRKHFKSLVQAEFSPLLFRPTQSAIPTGSVYKPITAIAGLEEGEITLATSFRCEGRKRFHGRWFHCTGFHRDIGLLKAIERSCNIYFYEVAKRLKGEKLASWGKSFGLGQNTGIDLPYERSGNLPTPQTLFGRLNLAIGQGKILCTPLQVARVYATIANGGVLIQPHLLDRVTGPEGELVRYFEPDMKTIDVKAETMKAVKRGMYRVTSSTGTARHADLRPFGVAGKTGTAEIGIEGINHAWFAGFAPYEDPKIAFAVVSERNPGHGGSHAAPIIRRVLEKIWPSVKKMP